MGATFGPESGQPEVACQSDLGGFITSGGGFSDYNPRPYWQDGAVNEYFEQYPPNGMFNQNGRGYPDVSLLGHNYAIVIGGKLYSVSGTSASTPTFAGMVSLVNAARLREGKGPIGFLNIILYESHHHYANDITVGNNSCSSNGICCKDLGFNATKGWDPVTGLGSINFKAFMKYLKSLGDGDKEKRHGKGDEGDARRLRTA